MEKRYRIVFESYENNKPEITISKTTLLDDGIEKPTSLLDLSMGIDKQISLIQGVDLDKITVVGKESDPHTSKISLACAVEITNEYYDRGAIEYYNRTINLDLSATYEKFLRHIVEGGHILDAGCGAGRDAKFFKGMGYNITAIDASVEMVKLSTELIGQPTLNLKIEEIELNNQLNGIWANASLLHVPSKYLPETLEKLYIALKKRGVLFASFKYGQGEYVRAERLFNDQNEESIKDLFIPFQDFEIIEMWKTQDVGSSTTGFWLNILAQKN